MPVLPHDIEEVRELLDIYAAIYPTNYDQEKKRFFNALEQGDTYNPQYSYDTASMSKAEKLLGQVRSQIDTPLGERLLHGLEDTKQMIQVIGTPEITAASKAAYGFPDDRLIKKAKEMYHEPVDHGETRNLDAKTIRDAFIHMFDTLGMEYECRLISEETNRNDPLHKQILIGKDMAFTPIRAKRMVIHESTHAVRTVNGMQTGEPALIYGTKGYETAEEGLPTFNESTVGVFDDTVPKITSRVIAIAAADQSFHDMYTVMRRYGLSERLAFIRTYRIKRGLADTSQPGGFIKDHIYFAGYSRIAEHPYLADDLYVGKTSFEDMADLGLEYDPMITRDDHISAYNDVEPMLEEPN